LLHSSIYDKEPHEARPDVVEELKKQLREKDLVLTDIRLEALSSAHQLESLKDTVIKMRVSEKPQMGQPVTQLCSAYM
jgi:neuron navigator 2